MQDTLDIDLMVDQVPAELAARAVGRATRSRDLTSIIRSYFGPDNGVDLELPERDAARKPL